MTRHMRAAFTTVLVVAGVCAAAQEPIVVPVVDRSAMKVVEFSGSVTFAEARIENQQVVTWCTRELVAKNVSAKPLVLLIAEFDARSSFGGCNVQQTLRVENFFTDAYAPGASFVAVPTGAPQRTMTCCHKEDEKLAHPVAEARLIFAQFADGTTVGDANAAADVLKTRAAIIEGLRSLETAYERGGAKAFLDLLHTPFGGAVDWVFNRHRELAAKEGTEAAIARVRTSLRNAREHELTFSRMTAGQ